MNYELIIGIILVFEGIHFLLVLVDMTSYLGGRGFKEVYIRVGIWMLILTVIVLTILLGVCLIIEGGKI